MAVGDTNDLINYINQEMAKSFERPEDDLGIAIGDPRPKGEWVQGLRVRPIEDHDEGVAYVVYDEADLPTEVRYQGGRNTWKRKYLPRPPYRCICGETFQDAKSLMDHRHEPGSVWILR